jgi:hypothetical protein
MKIAKVATIGEPEIEERADGNYLWVPVFLHPQQLCQLIQSSQAIEQLVTQKSR